MVLLSNYSSYLMVMSFLFFFFFQAEDGIRDLIVTGVQTCALPIFEAAGMVEREVVAQLVSIHPQLVVGVAPRLVGVSDVCQAGPATGESGHDVEPILVIGKVVARRRGRLVGQVADGGEIAVRRGGRAREQPAPGGGVRGTACRRRGGARHSDIELLLTVGDFVVVIRHA